MKRDRLDNSRALLEGNMNAAFRSQLTCSMAAFFYLSSATLQGSTSLLQPVEQQKLPLGWGPPICAVILRLKQDAGSVVGGNTHTRRERRWENSSVLLPRPMCPSSASRYLQGCLCTTLPAAPVLSPLPPSHSKTSTACW